MVEFIDIVDKNNKPLNIKKNRNDVHKDGDWHRASHIIIINNNEVLCNKRSSKKDIFPNQWDIIVGGHVKSGETFETTAILELREELGIKAKKLKLIRESALEMLGKKLLTENL
jgi:8-oxo-dGTP diphosphatase